MPMPPLRLCLAASTVALAAGSGGAAVVRAADTATLDASALPRIGEVDSRYQSYNVEMLEVTGGNFWKPYASIAAGAEAGATGAAAGASEGNVPAGMDASLYEYRPPLDLDNPRLRTLAQALGPAYVRVSGTWANSTWFADAEEAPETPPAGYDGVLTQDQWRALIDFSKAVNAEIVTSVPTSAGTRDANAVWQPDQARRWLDFTRDNGGVVAAAEYMNEPTMAEMGGAPKGYTAADFGRDFRTFEAFMRDEFPDTRLLAPGSVGEANADWGVAQGGYGDFNLLSADALAQFTGGADAFSYHHYGATSQRCEAMGHQTTPEAALSEDWLGRTDATLAYYRGVRDHYMPGKPFWNTETADAACGGNPWGGQFLDTFRYLDQLGRLARQEVEVVAHNTLVASDYGLLDDQTFAPKPDYWGALLWRRLMGPVVLDSGIPIAEGRHVYAHCLRDVAGGVALLVINNSRSDAQTLSLAHGGERYTLTSPDLQSREVLLNGQPLALTPDDGIPELTGEAVEAGEVAFAPASISFIAMPAAGNTACH